jgi:hypothetical protein
LDNIDPDRTSGAKAKEIIMNIRHLAIAAALTVAFAAPAAAQNLKPVQALSIDLGTVSGVAYYTAERDGFRVVATLAQQGEDAAPIRLEALLVPGQSVVLSTPRGAGAPAEAVEISRQADTVLVRKASIATTN